MTAPPTFLNKHLGDFPGHNASVATGLVLILLTGFVVVVKLALGQPFPTGYDGWLIFLATLAGVSTAGMIGKRATDIDYKAAGASQVTVEAPSTVTITPDTPGPKVDP